MVVIKAYRNLSPQLHQSIRAEVLKLQRRSTRSIVKELAPMTKEALVEHQLIQADLHTFVIKYKHIRGSI